MNHYKKSTVSTVIIIILQFKPTNVHKTIDYFENVSDLLCPEA